MTDTTLHTGRGGSENFITNGDGDDDNTDKMVIIGTVDDGNSDDICNFLLSQIFEIFILNSFVIEEISHMCYCVK